MPDNFRRAFMLKRVIDGDTIVPEDIDLGYHVHLHSSDHFEITYRILHVNSPEMKGTSRRQGQVAKDFTAGWLAVHASHGGLFAETIKTDSLNRYLAVITCGQDHDLAEGLLASGNAVEFDPK
jgi:endonuclease YncB( thermonuclease family)